MRLSLLSACSVPTPKPYLSPRTPTRARFSPLSLASAARLLVATTFLAAAPAIRASTVTWTGAQYTPGPGYPASWPTEGSFFDPDNWQGAALPASTDSAVFGTLQPLPNGNTTNSPHTIHFGNFGYYADTVIPGGTGSLTAATITQGVWTFYFSSGQNPDFTGTLTPSIGALAVSSLTLSPGAGQFASLTVRNGALTASTLTLATQTGPALLALASGASLTSAYGTVGASGAGSFVQSGGTHSVSGSLVLGSNSTAVGVYSLDNGLLSVPGREILGQFGTGTFTQSNGTHTSVGPSTNCGFFLGYFAGSSGSYNLQDGVFTTAFDFVGERGTGTFTQTGGTHTVAGTFANVGQLVLGHEAGSTGAYTLGGGQLTVTYGTYLGDSGSGTFIQTGGIHSSPGVGLGFRSGAKGVYTLSDGVLSTSGVSVGSFGTGTFTQTAGTHTLANTLYVGAETGSYGIYTLSNGILTTGSVDIGRFGSGRLVQNSGTHTARFFKLGANPGGEGSYTLSSGQLTVSYEEIISDAGTAVFTQSGGTHTASGISMGHAPGGFGTYTLSNGSLKAYYLIVGSIGTGRFLQSGGSNTLTGDLSIGSTPTAAGSYTLSGTGTLSASNLYLGGISTAAGGTGSFTVAGGTATIANTLKLWGSTNTVLALSGGTLSVGTLDTSAAPYAFAWTAGVLNLTGSTAPSLTVPTAGTLRGTVTVQGNLRNNGTLTPGDSVGRITIQGTYVQLSTATLSLKIAGKALSSFDRLAVQDDLTLAGIIALDFLPGYIPAPGDSFDILDWSGSFTNNGYTFDFSQAPLPSNLAWNTSTFATNGQISIAPIPAPEPASLALLALSAPFLLSRRRSRSAAHIPAPPLPSRIH